MAERNVTLKVVGLRKHFGAVKALDGVDLDIHAGEVHALVGENGAGKSTLINLLTGALQPDAGKIFLAGKEVSFRNSYKAAQAGIAAVFQELSLVGSLSVAENIFANRQPVNAFNFIRTRELYDRTREMLRTFDVAIDPRELVGNLSIAQQQVIEILKALAANPCVLLLDEPTSSLTRRETEILFNLIRRLRSEGEAIIYVSHHLPEVLELADRVTVLRDGMRVRSKLRAELTEADIIRWMVGRIIRDIYGERSAIDREVEPRLAVENLTRVGYFENISFKIWPGEIVGMAGLVGAGRTEVGRAIFGSERSTGGRILLDGYTALPKSPAHAKRLGIAYVTEDRKTQGLYLGQSIRDNLAAPRLEKFQTRLGFVRDKHIDGYAEAAKADFHIVAPHVYQSVNRLSGGNQQKVLLASWMGLRPRVLIADEPTRGVDVGARTEIYEHLRHIAAGGASILLISSDLQEILGMSDRVLVMRNGRLAAEFAREDATEERLIAAALETSSEGDQG